MTDTRTPEQVAEVLGRLATYIEVAPSGCWLWRGCLARNGYGRLRMNGRRVMAHRAVYEKCRGAIPIGLTIDHLCRVRECVNPAHLEAVTFKENVLRGVSFSAQNAAKDRCPRGHEYSGENLFIRKCGARGCRECYREQMRRAQKKRLAKMTPEERRAMWKQNRLRRESR